MKSEDSVFCSELAAVMLYKVHAVTNHQFWNLDGVVCRAAGGRATDAQTCSWYFPN